MRIVIKIGTSTLTHTSGRLNIRRTEELCKVIADLKNAGLEVIIVSSGAIAMGVGKMSLPGRPEDVPTKQALAAVGQCELMYIYDQQFSRYNHAVGQILITAEDIPLCGHAALRDTMTDLILDLVGSLLVAIFGIFYHDKAIEKYDILIKMMKIDNEGIAENVE